ncbi:helix-turn-helix domain-containing protein [Gordonia desulfuricans]|uniref:Helix-turn-helix domain-containing protein n=1 Tax=Gordonia desulfuricans TaxID=89051 RepID=A0A7K3LRE9_9ACTN|nr:helix-turn-helix domain-containing protein [Gordonia desulfuricans]NDK90788.1 helix-turn-helix domain-containing protein [Gordonia desulfuricans]
MEEFNAIAVLGDVAATDENIDTIVDALTTYSPAVSEDDNGRIEVTYTLGARDGSEAVTTAHSVIAARVLIPTGVSLRSLHVLPTADWDTMVDRLTSVPTLSVAAAAERLGISRQAVHKAIGAGRLTAKMVGGRNLITEASVAALASTAH